MGTSHEWALPRKLPTGALKKFRLTGIQPSWENVHASGQSWVRDRPRRAAFDVALPGRHNFRRSIWLGSGENSVHRGRRNGRRILPEVLKLFLQRGRPRCCCTGRDGHQPAYLLTAGAGNADADTLVPIALGGSGRMRLQLRIS